jgi:hypothetical protein
VDASQGSAEGATVGWIVAGEWLEYTIDVKTSGLYTLTLRYSSGNSSGGGPFHIELDDKKISGDIPMASTGKWDTWMNKTISNLEMPSGKHILRLVFDNGEFNLGKMSFAYSSPLGYNPPLANAGANVKVMVPATTGSLDGTLSSDPDSDPLSYTWEQVYGPSIIVFSDSTSVSPGISNLESGIYQVRLTVSDGTYTSTSEVLVIVTSLANLDPFVSITSPANNFSVYELKTIVVSANATDLDGTISLVEFYDGINKIGEVFSLPFSISWADGSIGEHSITAKATDNGGATTTSAPVIINITSSPSCLGGPLSGDYTYRFTPDKNNPTLTFVTGTAGVGSPTCILYYATSAGGPFPGYNVKPNVPYRISASEGSIIYFYYTYSFNGMERNTSAAMHTYETGSCTGSPPFLTVSVPSLTVAAGANSKATLNVDTNTGCSITSDQTWLSVSTGSVNMYTIVTVTAEANPTAVQRTAILTISGAGVTTKLVTVKQAAGPIAVKDVLNEGISLYPVPASDKIFIMGLTEKSVAGIYNICGNLMQTTNLDKTENEIDLSRLSKGVYFIKLQTDKRLVVKQFVKQ